MNLSQTRQVEGVSAFALSMAAIFLDAIFADAIIVYAMFEEKKKNETAISVNHKKQF